jgi:hypothetical protein
MGQVRVPIAADITDYLAGIRHARAPSGVTRVQTRLLAADRGHFTLVAHHGPSDSWRAFPRAMFDRLLAGTHGTGGVGDPAWQALVDEAEAVLAASPEHRWAPGDWLLGIGTAWWLPGHSGRILAAKEEHGIRYASFVYDLIPLLVPEHCEPKLVRNFTQHFAALCLLADHAICISEAVRRISWPGCRNSCRAPPSRPACCRWTRDSTRRPNPASPRPSPSCWPWARWNRARTSWACCAPG